MPVPTGRDSRWLFIACRGQMLLASAAACCQTTHAEYAAVNGHISNAGAGETVRAIVDVAAGGAHASNHRQIT